MISIKKLCNFLIFGKISLGHKEQETFEEKATEENSVRTIRFIHIYIYSETYYNGHLIMDILLQNNYKRFII